MSDICGARPRPVRALMVAALAAALVVGVAAPGWAQRLPGARSLSDTPWGYALVSAPVRAGRWAQRFEVRAGDCAANGGWDDCARDRERSEFRLDHEWLPGTRLWIGFSVFLPADFPVSDRVRTTIAQIHQRGGPIRVADGLQSRPPVMQLELVGEELRLTVHQPGAPNIHRPLAALDQLRGRWVDVALLHDAGALPVIEVWLDGARRARVEGWDMPPPDFFYFKYGIYRSFVSRQGGPMPTQIAWFDEVRLGAARAEVLPNAANPVD